MVLAVAISFLWNEYIPSTEIQFLARVVERDAEGWSHSGGTNVSVMDVGCLKRQKASLPPYARGGSLDVAEN